MEAMKRISIVTAGASEQSSTTLLAQRVGREVVKALEAGGLGGAEQAEGTDAGVEVSLVELRDLAGELGVAMGTGMVGDRLREALGIVARADGLIVATPVYKASYSGLFKSFFDVLDDDAILSTPTILVATAGTPRHALVPDQQMRPLFAYLRALVVPTSVFAAGDDWQTAALTKRAARAAAEIAPLIHADTKGRTLATAGGAYDQTYAVGDNAPQDPTAGLDFDSDLMRLAAGGQ